MTVAPPPATVSRAETMRNRTIIARLMAKLNAGLKTEVLADCEALGAEEPDHPAALYALSALAFEHGAIKAAFDTLARAHERDPNESIYAEMLAVLYAVAGNPREATYYAKLSASLGLDGATLALLPRALPAFTQALAVIQETPYLIKAEAQAVARHCPEAVTLYEQHLAFFPNDPAATRGIVRALLALNQPVRALAHLSEFLDQNTTTALDMSLLGEAYTALGNIPAATASHHNAVALDPESLEIGCARLRDAVFDPSVDAPALAALSRAWAGTLTTRPRPEIPEIGNRPLRVGYLVSATRDPRDLETIAAVLGATDSRRITRLVYGHRSIDDMANTRLHYSYDRWNDISGCDPDTLAAIIEGDNIDVLVDTGGHAAPIHLAAMALRPAPWQVSWLGNSGTLGLDTLDAEWGDAFEFAPATPESRHQAVSGGIWCYERAHPVAKTAPGPTDTFVFGVDLKLPQLQDDLLTAWGHLLARVPTARLALRDHEFVDGNLLSWLVTRFRDVGIAERIDIVTADSETFSAQVDAVLAPFVELNPHNSAAALRQGTPVVALAGAGRQRRQSAAFLRRNGLSGFVAETLDGYIDLAAGLAESPETWRAATATVTRTLETAPSFQPATVAAGLQAALWTLLERPGLGRPGTTPS